MHPAMLCTTQHFKSKGRNMQKRIFAIALSVLVLATIASAADDPFVGTWRLNVAKSQIGMMTTSWKSGTIKIEAQEGGIKSTSDFSYENGTITHAEVTYKRDGRDYPVTGETGGYYDSVSSRKIDANTVESVYKLAGKEVAIHQWVVSKDGKTSTVTMKYTGMGLNMNQVMFLQRQ
jgi:hypothetical protein